MSRLIWKNIKNAWSNFWWGVYTILVKFFAGPKLWKEGIAPCDRNIIFALMVLAVAIVAVELIILVAIYGSVIFHDWRWSLAAAFTTLVVGYLIYDSHIEKRERREREYAAKHIGPLL